MSGLKRTQTLVDIARHSNKVIRLSRLMEETDAEYLVDKMGFLDSQSDPFDVMQAMDADLSATIKMLKDVSLMVDSLDSQHQASELKSEENDFTQLFPNNYNPETQTLNLFGIPIKKGGDFKKIDTNELKSALYDQIFSGVKDEYPFSDYRAHLSILRSMEKTGRPSKEAPFHEGLKYASQLAQVPKWRKFYRAAIDSAGRFHDFRRGLSDKERRLVDEKVYSGRAMIYGVVKSSTYITKEGVASQISSAHKKEPGLLQKISGLVKEIDCIIAVEIDQNTSLEKFHDMLVDIKDMKLDVPDAFELKTRLLGNYRASGLFAKVNSDGMLSLMPEFGFSSKEFKMVAVDVNSPTSIAHEITHFRDQDPDDQVRNSIVRHFGEKMDISVLEEILPDARLEYYADNREVLARLGEIGFKLLQHNYQENESLESFIERVRSDEGTAQHHDDKIGYQVSLSKPIDSYLGGNIFQREIYFKLEQWTPTELSILKDYCHSYFYSPDEKIQARLKERLDSGELQYQSKKYHEEKVANTPSRVRRMTDDDKVGSTLGNIAFDDLPDIYEAGVKARIFEDGEFSQQIFRHVTRLGNGGGKKGKKSIDPASMKRQMESYMNLFERIDPTISPGEALVAQAGIMELMEAMRALPMLEQDAVEPFVKKRSFLDQMTLLARSYGPYLSEDESIDLKEIVATPFVAGPFLITNPKQREASSAYQVLVERAPGVLQKLEDKLPQNLPLALQGSTPIAQWAGVSSELYRLSLIEKGKPSHEHGQDYLDALTTYQTAEFLDGMTDEDLPRYVQEAFAGTSFEKILPYRGAMKEALKEPALASSMLSGGVLNKFDIKAEHINSFMEDVQRNLEEHNPGNYFEWTPLSHSDNHEDIIKKMDDYAELRSQRIGASQIDVATILTGSALLAGASSDELVTFVGNHLKSEDVGIDWDKLYVEKSTPVFKDFEIANGKLSGELSVLRGRLPEASKYITMNHGPGRMMKFLMSGEPEMNDFGSFVRTANDFAKFSTIHSAAAGILSLAQEHRSYSSDHLNELSPYHRSHYESVRRTRDILAEDKQFAFSTLKSAIVAGFPAMQKPWEADYLHNGAMDYLEEVKKEYLPFWVQANAMSPAVAKAALGGLAVGASRLDLPGLFENKIHREISHNLVGVGRAATYPIFMEGNVFKGIAPLLEKAIAPLKPVNEVKLKLSSQPGKLPRATLDEWVNAARNHKDSVIPWDDLSKPQIGQLANYAKSELGDGELYQSILTSGLQSRSELGNTPRDQMDQVVDHIRNDKPLSLIDLEPEIVADFIKYAHEDLDDELLVDKIVEFYFKPGSLDDDKPEVGGKEPIEEVQPPSVKEKEPVSEPKEPLGSERQMRMF